MSEVLTYLFKSASKITLLLMALGLMIAFLAVVLMNLDVKEIVLAVIAIASSAIGSVFTYYFTRQNGR